jgi:hypothetical protein
MNYKKGIIVEKALSIMTCFLLTSCLPIEKKVFSGPSPGIEYHNQNTAPWPWVSVVPSERALALKEVDFEEISHQLHFDMSFEPNYCAFKDVRIVLLDYTILPPKSTRSKQLITKPNKYRNRPSRYFMVASFYTIGRRPPCPPDFEITTSIRTDKAGAQEAMRFMAHDIVDEISTLSDENLLTFGRKITVNLD